MREACASLGSARSTYYARKRPRGERRVRCADGELSARILAIKGDHPFWGHRRVRAWLVHREKVMVNEKRGRRLMKEHALMVTRTVHKAKRTPQGREPRADRPREVWGIDMTTFMVPVIGWVYRVRVVDWYTKKVVGWDVSLRSRAAEWKWALDRAIGRECPRGVRGEGLRLVSENGSQPTATSCMKDMVTLGIEQIFPSYDNPKGNADTERMMRTIKEEVLWLNEGARFEEAKETIGRWIEGEYNPLDGHSALGYRSPEECERLYNDRLCLEKAA